MNHLKTLDRSPGICITTLCLLYAAQGIPDGFVRVGLKTYLIDQGVSTAAIGVTIALVSWPWSLKWVWGPFVDRFRFHRMGRRRPWILAAQTGIMLSLASLLFIPDLSASLKALSIVILLANTFASLQDVSVDAMAIDQLPPEKRGIANGFMYGSSYAGSYVGSYLLGGLLLTSGIVAAVSLQIGILFFIALFPLLFRERRQDRFVALGTHRAEDEDEERASVNELFAKLGKSFSVRSSWLAAVFALTSLICTNAYLIVWPVYMKEELGWSTSDYLTLEGGLSVWFGLGGSVAGGLIASLLGPKRALFTALSLMAITWGLHGLLMSWWSDTTVVSWLFLLSAMLQGFFQVSMFSMFMEIAWPPVAATQFTAYMAMLNLSNGLGASSAGLMESAFSMQGFFWVLVGIQLAGGLLLLFIDPTQTRRVLHAAP